MARNYHDLMLYINPLNLEKEPKITIIHKTRKQKLKQGNLPNHHQMISIHNDCQTTRRQGHNSYPHNNGCNNKHSTINNITNAPEGQQPKPQGMWWQMHFIHSKIITTDSNIAKACLYFTRSTCLLWHINTPKWELT